MTLLSGSWNEWKGKTEKRAFLSDKQIGRLITDLGIDKMTKKVQETVIESTKVEDEIKNV